MLEKTGEKHRRPDKIMVLPRDFSACSPRTCGTDREKIKHLKGKCGSIERRLSPRVSAKGIILRSNVKNEKFYFI